MRKIGIIGMGNVGTTVAYTLLTKGIADELVLIDSNHKKETAEFYDFMDALSILPTHTKIIMNNFDALRDADIIVTAFGDIKLSVEGNDRFGELKINAQNAKEIGLKLKDIHFNGIILNISNPCDAICMLLQHYTGLSKQHVIGTGTSLDTARMKRALAMNFEVDAHNIQGFVLGEHGDSQFTAWSTVTLNQLPLKTDHLDLAQLENDTRNGAWVIVEGKGYTSYGIASCAVEIIESIFSDARRLLVVSCYIDAYQTYVGYPAIIGKNGIDSMIQLPLTESEEQKLQHSAQTIADKTAQYLA